MLESHRILLKIASGKSQSHEKTKSLSVHIQLSPVVKDGLGRESRCVRQVPCRATAYRTPVSAVC